MTKNVVEQLGGIQTDTHELELTDADILDAMQNIPGYLDISAEDFRVLYHLAYHHAQGRMFAEVSAGRLMRSAIQPLQQDMTLDIAAQTLADSGYKGLPVVDDNGRVIGMLTETDFLRHMHANSFMELLLRILEDAFEFTHGCHETTVSAVMSKPVVTVGQHAGFSEIHDTFHRHGGRSMPVLGDDGRMLGLLLREDFFAVTQLKVS